MVNSGADLLVAAPISPSVILDRIDSLINNRKPFVVTNDYVGPDRRYQQDRDSDIEQIEVPNTLRDRALGQYNANAVKAAIEATRESIDGQRIDRHTFQVSFVADEICACYAKGDIDSLPKMLRELEDVTEKLRGKAEEYGNQEIEQLCFPLKSVVEQLIRSKGDVRPKDIELLGQLSLAFRACLQAGDQGAALVADISKTVAAAGAA